MTTDLTINPRLKKRWVLTGIAATVIIILSVPIYIARSYHFHERPGISASESAPQFVGRKSCVKCHRKEYDKWENSHHDLAMDYATRQTVLGDFNNAVFRHRDTVTRFYRKDGLFFVNTPGADGKPGDFQVTHTFGAWPLQQYLIPFPGGRLQCLTIAWDVPGKKWYALPNHTDDPQDWLYWTRGAQNWNGMCAQCHSTNLKKGYDATSDTFSTTWSEIDVSCEACHGPASDHVEWAELPEMAREKTDNYRLAVRTRNITPEARLDICAGCHSRRASIDDFSHFAEDRMDYMIPSLLTEGLYHPDGQILDEVYVYGSFTQSKMHQRGVKCSDCHDVHSLMPKIDGNGLCLQCHRKDVYDTKDHHFHKQTDKGKPGKGDDCISCHMPQSPYMGIDMRADHSIRIPRPDLSITCNTPNSCNTAGCHSDKPAAWSAEKVKTWYGIRKRPHYGPVFHAGRSGVPEAESDLVGIAKDQLLPPVVRATALSLLRSYPGDDTLRALEEALCDDQALIRYTAISSLNTSHREKRTELVTPLLYDPVMAVRTQAALALAPVASARLTKPQMRVFTAALEEYRASMEYSSDFASGRYNLGLLDEALKKPDTAAAHYREALKIDDRFFPAKNNLAMLLNRQGKNREAIRLFKEILEDNPDFHEINYSLGLILAEEKQYVKAAAYLEKAAAELPQRARIHYNLGLLLQRLADYDGAERHLIHALALEPGNMDFMVARADSLIKSGRIEEAEVVAETIIVKHPEYDTGYLIRNHIRRLQRSRDRLPEL